MYSKGDKAIPAPRLARVSTLIEPWFMFSLVWTIGGTCDNNGREKFDKFLRSMFQEANVSHTLDPLSFHCDICSLLYDF